jgi:hypothetical protein
LPRRYALRALKPSVLIILGLVAWLGSSVEGPAGADPRALQIGIQESVGVTETVEVLPPLVLNVRESVRVIDRVDLLPPLVINIQESMKVTDGVDIREGTPRREDAWGRASGRTSDA